MANIFDVAKKAGVSKSTVSRVFSHGYVSDEKRKRVLRAASELQYVPSPLARQLRWQKTKTIGLIAKTYYPAVGDIVNYVTHYSELKGYNVIIYFTETKQDEINILNDFKLHALDGLFFVANRNRWATIESYAEYGPIVTWRRIKSKNVYSSYIDHYPLYTGILRYVIKKYGSVKIGHILNDPEKNNTKARLKAITDIESIYPNVNNDWALFYPEQEHAGEKTAVHFLKSKEKPKVIIAYSDYIAAAFISSVQKAGLRVPEDVKVFGFDNSDFGRYMKISTVDTFLAKQTENSVNKIISYLDDQPFKELKITPKIIIRKTC